jgi:hypothetical protein
LSIGSVAVAFEAVCPTRLDLLHQHYRRLCRTLVDVDDWGQADLLALLIRYARTMLPRPIVVVDASGEKEEVDDDVQLLLSSAEPLFRSHNPAVGPSDSIVLARLNIIPRSSSLLHAPFTTLHLHRKRASLFSRFCACYISLLKLSALCCLTYSWSHEHSR